MSFILLALLITLRICDTLRGYSKAKNRPSYDFMFLKGKLGSFKVYKQGCMGFIPCLQDGLLFSKVLKFAYK